MTLAKSLTPSPWLAVLVRSEDVWKLLEATRGVEGFICAFPQITDINIDVSMRVAGTDDERDEG